MRKNRVALAFAGIAAGLAALFTVQAEASPRLPQGNAGDAGVLWYFGNSDQARDVQCHRVGKKLDSGKRLTWAAMVHDLHGDVIGDNFRNARQVEAWTVQMARKDCVSLTYLR